MRSVIFTIIGIAALGWGLETLAPPHWIYGEFFLLAASIVVIRDYLLAEDRNLRTHGAGRSMLAANSAWFADPDDIDDPVAVFHPWDLDHAPGRARKTNAARMLPDARSVHAHKQSVEQIAHDVLMQAFHQASRTYHPDRGGDPEDMRRVQAAREMLLRAIHKP